MAQTAPRYWRGALLNAASNTAWSPYLQFGGLEFQAFNRSPGSLRSDFAVTNIANSRSLSRTVNSLFSNNLLLAAVYLRLSSLAGTKGSTLSTSRDSAGGVCPWAPTPRTSTMGVASVSTNNTA